ncbi:MAG: hypothetical protein QHH75_13125 [Bacillota bacterium]|jgi:hypothetical protein|nr:hypothetical protein [Bacillota bacterium]
MKNCRKCALGKSVKPEEAVFCSKFNRVFPPQEAVQDWGCRYFSEAVPDEKYDTYQYLLLKETELAERK